MLAISLRRLSLLTLGLACAGSCLLSAPARACEVAPCTPGIVVPDRGASVPANVPGFPVTPEQVVYWPLDAAPASSLVELLDGAGQLVPTDIVSLSTTREYVLVPKAQLDPGSYQFRRQVSCTVGGGFSGAPSPAATEERAFTVTAASALPANTGTVEVGPAELATYRVSDYGGGCSSDVTASLAKLTVKPSAELAPFLSVARIEVRVDGNSWAISNWGDFVSVPRSFYVAYRVYDELFTTCVGGSSSDRGLPEGAHQGTLTVWLPNVKDPLPPVSFSFSTSCAGVAALSDGGVLGSDGATSGDGRNSDADDSRAPSPDGNTTVTLNDASTSIDSNGPDTALATAVDAGTQITKADAGTNGADAANQGAGRGKSGCGYLGSPASGGVTSLLVLLGLACVLCRRTRGSEIGSRGDRTRGG